MNHMPWDNGTIDAAMKQVLGIGSVNKTTKTRCGKRVSISQANYNQPITCSACLVDIETERKFVVEQKMILGL